MLVDLFKPRLAEPASPPPPPSTEQPPAENPPLLIDLFKPKPAATEARPAEQPSLFAWLQPKVTAPEGTTSAPAGDPAPPGILAPAAGERGVVVVTTRFDILRIRVPKGFFSVSGKVWNHLDQQTIPAETASLLERNGLRVGMGGTDAWAPIQAMLEREARIETSSTSMTLANGLPLTINMNQGRYRDETLFLFRRDRTLAGVSFPMSTNLIRVEYGIAVEQPTAVQLDVMPQIQQRPSRGQLHLNELGELEVPLEEPVRVIRELAFRVVVPPGQFVAIGPSQTAWDGHLTGSLLLCEEIDGNSFESMYFLTPALQRSDQKVEP